MDNNRDRQPSSAGQYLNDSRVLSRRFGPTREGGAVLSIWGDAAQALLSAAAEAEAPFRTALLLGQAGNTGAGVVTEIRAWAELETYRHEQAFVAELMTSWEQTVNRLSRAYRGLVLCGWASIRAASGGALRPDAEMVHRTFFGLPWQVTLVVDPSSEALAFYGPTGTGELVNVGFNVLSRNKVSGDGHADR